MPRTAVASARTKAGTRTTLASARTSVTTRSAGLVDPTYPVSIFVYLPFIGGATQGSTGTAAASNLASTDASRKGAIDAMMLPGIAGASYVPTWEAVEGFAPVGGARTYDFTTLDTALTDMARFSGKKAMFRVNAGTKLSVTNYIIGGATGSLNVAVSSGTTLQVNVRSDYRPPAGTGVSVTATTAAASPTLTSIASTAGITLGMYCLGSKVANPLKVIAITGTSVTLSGNASGISTSTYWFGQIIALTVTPGINSGTSGQEAFIIASVGAPTGTVYPVTVGAAVQLSHPINTLVEWSQIPTTYAANTAYLIGDMLLAPPGTTIAEEGVDNRIYSVTKAYTSSAGGTASIALGADLAQGANGALSQSIWFADDTGDVMPCPWDAVSIFNHGALINALGARYDNNPLLFAMQCSGAGFLGEGTLNAGTANQVVSNWIGNGYTDRRVVDAWKAYVDLYATAFTRTKLCIDLDEPFGPTFNGSTGMPVTIQKTATGVGGNNGTTTGGSTISLNDTSSIAVGMLVNGPGVCNAYVDVISANVSVTLKVSPNLGWAGGGQSPAYVCPATCVNGPPATSGVFEFGGRKFTIATATSDGASPATISVTMPAGTTLSPIILGMAITGTGVNANSFVGTLTGSAPNYTIKLSDRRTRQSGTKTATSGAIAGGVTLTSDQLPYVNPYILQREITGRNTGGSLVADVWTSPTVQEAGYTANYPGRFGFQQNGLIPGDLNSNPQGRFRPSIAGANAFNTPPATQSILAAWGGGYQMHDGTNHTFQNCVDMFKLGFDDGVSYYEYYLNDVTVAGSGLIIQVASNVRPL